MKHFLLASFFVFLSSISLTYAQTRELVDLGPSHFSVIIKRSLPKCVVATASVKYNNQAGTQRDGVQISLENNCESDFVITGFERDSSTLSYYWPMNMPGARIHLHHEGSKEDIKLFYNPHQGSDCITKIPNNRVCKNIKIPNGYRWEIFLKNMGFTIKSGEDFVTFYLYNSLWHGTRAKMPIDWWKENAITEPDEYQRSKFQEGLSHSFSQEKNWSQAYFWAVIAIKNGRVGAEYNRELAALNLSSEEIADITKQIEKWVEENPELVK